MISSHQNAPNVTAKKGVGDVSLKQSDKLSNLTNTRKGGGTKLKTHYGPGNKPKPLQLSTNTIHVKQQIGLGKPRHNKNIASQNDDLKKKNKETQSSKAKEAAISDENDVCPILTGPQEPMLSIHSLDEELYQKVLRLELASDGLPLFESEEPFDF